MSDKLPPRTGIEAFCYRLPNDYMATRPWMAAPWIHDGKTYATNGHILLVLPSAELPVSDNYPPEKGQTKIDEWLAAFPTKFIDLPSLPTFAPCAECGGAGLFSTVPGFYCDYCEGYGELPSRIAVGDVGFCVRYLRLLSTFPAIQFAPNGMTRAAFIFDGGRGFLMPMKE